MSWILQRINSVFSYAKLVNLWINIPRCQWRNYDVMSNWRKAWNASQRDSEFYRTWFIPPSEVGTSTRWIIKYAASRKQECTGRKSEMRTSCVNASLNRGRTSISRSLTEGSDKQWCSRLTVSQRKVVTSSTKLDNSVTACCCIIHCDSFLLKRVFCFFSLQ